MRREGSGKKEYKQSREKGSEKTGAIIKRTKEKRGRCCLRAQGGRRGRKGEEIRLTERSQGGRKMSNLRFQSCVLQSELLQSVGLADCVQNLVHHLGPLEEKEERNLKAPGTRGLKRKRM